MRLTSPQIEAAKYVTPRALRAYAQGLGWSEVQGVTGLISAFRSPDSSTRQVIIPNTTQIDDYADRVAETVARLAAFEGRAPQDVFDHVLLPPSDVIAFREVSPEAEVGNVTLEHGMRVLEGGEATAPDDRPQCHYAASLPPATLEGRRQEVFVALPHEYRSWQFRRDSRLPTGHDGHAPWDGTRAVHAEGNQFAPRHRSGLGPRRPNGDRGRLARPHEVPRLERELLRGACDDEA